MSAPADRTGFGALHPGVSFLLFFLVIAISVITMHPVLLGCSAAGALLLCIQLKGRRATARLLAGLVPLALFAAAINALFNHQGVTVIGSLWGQPLTREALIYGMLLALMLIAVLLWFTSYNLVFTSEKFFALFGRIIPSFALVTTMALRFVPHYLRQARRIAAAQRGLGDTAGRDPGSGSLATRLRSSFAILSILTSWALESAIDTADSMRARGYGTGRRSVYSPFRFTDRDAVICVVMLICTALVSSTLVTGVLSAQYLPRFLLNQGAAALSSPLRAALIAGAYAAFGLLCLLPALLNVGEELAWRISRSTI